MSMKSNTEFSSGYLGCKHFTNMLRMKHHSHTNKFWAKTKNDYRKRAITKEMIGLFLDSRSSIV